MNKDAIKSDSNAISLKIKQKIKELAELVSLEKYGPDGPPRELTFRQIEQLGHEVGQLASTTIDSVLQTQHATYFQQPEACPGCGAVCEASPTRSRELLTRHGATTLEEPQFHCSACERSFFPSANRTAH